MKGSCRVLALLLAWLPSVAAGQAASLPRTTWWGDWGGGVTVSDNPLGLTVRAAVGVERDRRVIVARAVSAIDIIGILEAAFGTDSGALSTADYGVLIGRAGGSGIWRRYAAVGVGAAEIHRSDAPPAYRVALLVEVAWAARLLPFAGVAAHLFGDLNTAQPFAGFTLGLQVGRLR